MKIYIAGTFEDQAVLRAPADALWKLGQEVVSTWLQETSRCPVLTSEEHKRKLAIKDITEVCSADLIILDNRRSSGGKNAEWGIGLHGFHQKLLWLVGEPSSVFHYLADKRFNSWQEVFDELRKI